jgi:hypothetical protein
MCEDEGPDFSLMIKQGKAPVSQLKLFVTISSPMLFHLYQSASWTPALCSRFKSSTT